MSELNWLGTGRIERRNEQPATAAHVLLRRPLHQVMAFTGRSIDEIVNSPVAKNHVRRYFKVHRLVQRRSEILELEDQWNPLSAR
jgi:hypothetical protein